MAEADVSMKTMTDSGSSNMSKLQSIGKGALLGIGAAVVGVGVAAVDFGDKLEASQSSLQAALKAAGISWDSVKGSVSATGDAATKFGFTQAQVDSALAQGIISTQNYGEAHKILGVAIDVAATKHISLQQAMLVVTKATEGQSRALKQLGIDLPVVQSNALKVKQAHDALSAAQLNELSVLDKYGPAVEQIGNKNYPLYEAAALKVAAAHHKLTEEQNAGGQILDALSKRLKGQAAAAADTFAGRIAAIKAQGENMAAQIGLRLIPVLESLVGAVMKVVNWFIQHKSITEALAIVIGTVLVAAIGVYIASAAAAAVASIAAFGWVEVIAAGVALLIAGIILLATHWQTVWNGIKSVAETVWNDGLQPVFNFIKTLGIDFIEAHIIILQGIWQAAWTTIQTVVQTAWSIIGPVFNFIKTLGIDFIEANILVLQTVWNTAWTVISGAIGVAKDIIGAIAAAINFAITGVQTIINGLEIAWNAVWSGITSAVQTAWGIIQPIFSTISSAISTLTGGLVNLGGGAAKLSTVTPGSISTGAATPMRAGGGPVSSMMPYIVGESGPELFIPSASGVVVPNGAGPLGGSPAGGVGGGDITVNLNIDSITFYSRTFQNWLSVAQQNKRSMVTLNL